MEKNGKALPQARTLDLVTRELPDEVLVYDLKRHKAHCLNQTAALIWKHCDGQNTIEDIATLMEKDLSTSVREEVVWYGIDRLNKANLLQERVSQPATTTDVSRRRMLGLVGTLSLPLVVSIIAPRAAQAATCGDADNMDGDSANGCACAGNMDCTSNCCGLGLVCVAVNSVPSGGMCRDNCECAGATMCMSGTCS
jgi:hypothetical protein